MKYLETTTRGIVKLITFRIWISISNFGFGWYMTGDWRAGFAYVGAAMIVNSIMVYTFDRAWNRVQWGKEVKIED